MANVTLGFPDIDASQSQVVGGKGANLGELSRIAGIQVPDGFCVGVAAFRRSLAGLPAMADWLDELAGLTVADGPRISALSGQIRQAIEEVTMPDDDVTAIAGHLARFGEHQAFAVRSSATAEDLPTASFAGQHDSYLNVVGTEAVLAHVRRCWASLFTERAVAYRIRQGLDHRQAHMAVVVQRMVEPQVSGVLFTADPVTGHRKVTTVDATVGLGEALVSGLVQGDSYRIRQGTILDRRLASTAAASHTEAGREATEPERPRQPALTEAQVQQLEGIGRTIEAHFGCPQDIEWCLVDDDFYVVQSRPITTLYPVPPVADAATHVYVSVAHQQMMTDAMTPLGLSFFRLTAGRPMVEAGGRLFVDITNELASPAKREMLIGVLGKSDPLIRDALTTLVDRGDVVDPTASEGAAPPSPPMRDFQTLQDYDPAIVAELIRERQALVDALQRTIADQSGPELFAFIEADVQQLRQTMADPTSFGVIMTAMNAAFWLNDHLAEWLGETNAADALSQSVPHNVTSAMGLALLDVADVIRPYPEVIAFLHEATDETLAEGLGKLDGGRQAWEAIQAFLTTYGMRGAGEIDITRPRWAETPTTLVPTILNHVKHAAPGAGARKFEQGRQQALAKERSVLQRLATLPDGDRLVSETTRMIDLVRAFAGFREYPKYHIVCRYFLYKQALWREGARLVDAGVLQEAGDIAFLRFEELRDTVRTGRLDPDLIPARKAAQRAFEALTPPRVMTSEGEIVTGRYAGGELPADALRGLPVSAGIVEGRARILRSMADAELEPGDILVTPYTDPSWTPVFVAIKGLITEVGGLMTHGAVIAREYGLPAVVGVADATTRIADGQRLRVNGTTGQIDLLGPTAAADG